MLGASRQSADSLWMSIGLHAARTAGAGQRGGRAGPHQDVCVQDLCTPGPALPHHWCPWRDWAAGSAGAATIMIMPLSAYVTKPQCPTLAHCRAVAAFTIFYETESTIAVLTCYRYVQEYNDDAASTTAATTALAARLALQAFLRDHWKVHGGQFGLSKTKYSSFLGSGR